MKKKLFSLVLAVALCLSLSVPALADSLRGDNECIFFTDGYRNSYTLISGVPASGGNDWNWDGKTFSIQGISFGGELSVSPYEDVTISLTGGALFNAGIFRAEGTKTVTIEDGSADGHGELVFYDPEPAGDFMVFTCDPGVQFILKDGLIMTGGPNVGDSYPLMFEDDGFGSRTLSTTDGKYANYARISKGSGNGTTVMQSDTLPTNFTDVSASSPYVDAIKWAVEREITNGTTATTFSPNSVCTVNHILTFISRAGRYAYTGGEGESINVWRWAIEEGLVSSNLNEYAVPDNVYNAPCTRAMAVTYLWKIAGSPTPKKTISFSDVPASASYVSAVSWAVEQGITKGTSATTFSPSSTCTRGQIVTFLYRAYSS